MIGASRVGEGVEEAAVAFLLGDSGRDIVAAATTRPPFNDEVFPTTGE